MSLEIDDILNSICSEVTLSHANDFQKVYTLATPLEAKLAFEVLVVYGLDVKVYHQADKPSKLYVTHPTFSAAQTQRIYAAAMAYAKTLKQIKLSMESLCQDNEAALPSIDYNIAFLKGQAQAKQILIQILPSAEAEALTSPAEPQAGAAQAAQATAAASVQSAATAAETAQTQMRAAGKHYEKPKTHYEELSSGPAVGRGNYPGKLSAEGEARQNSVSRRFGLVMFGNMATSTFAMLVMAVIVAGALSVFVMLKGFICPDLAVANKNKAWYCGTQHEEPQHPKQQILAPR
jgi:hypothetical protein